jgi:TM2 domain-containing membrane protein YozV
MGDEKTPWSDEITGEVNKTAELTKASTTEEKKEDENVSSKSRLALSLLAFFFGTIGVHDFYAGRIGKGITKIVLSVLGLIMYVVPLFQVVMALMGNIEYLTEDELINMLTSELMSKIVTIGLGIIMIIVVGIWVFVDFIIALAGVYKDKDGKKITSWN